MRARCSTTRVGTPRNLRRAATSRPTCPPPMTITVGFVSTKDFSFNRSSSHEPLYWGFGFRLMPVLRTKGVTVAPSTCVQKNHSLYKNTHFCWKILQGNKTGVHSVHFPTLIVRRGGQAHDARAPADLRFEGEEAYDQDQTRQ